MMNSNLYYDSQKKFFIRIKVFYWVKTNKIVKKELTSNSTVKIMILSRYRYRPVTVP
jgi:hypothetical protein